MAVCTEIKEQIFSALNISDSPELNIYHIGSYVQSILQLSLEERMGHGWYDAPTAEKTIEFLITKVNEGAKSY